MSVKEKIEDVERGLGAIVSSLEAGEYSQRDLQVWYDELQEHIDTVDDVRGENSDWLERSTGGRRHDLIEEQTGWLDDASSDMSEAEDHFSDALRAQLNQVKKYLEEVVCCLNRACNNLTEAMEVGA
jgi:hypothetical protein